MMVGAAVVASAEEAGVPGEEERADHGNDSPQADGIRRHATY